MASKNILKFLFNEPLETFKTTVIQINKELTYDTGEPHNILSEGGLESALGQLYQGWYNEEQTIAAVFRSLILNHCFENANKRTAFIVAASLKRPQIKTKEYENLVIQLASEGGSKIDFNTIANILYGKSYDQ